MCVCVPNEHREKSGRIHTGLVTCRCGKAEVGVKQNNDKRKKEEPVEKRNLAVMLMYFHMHTHTQIELNLEKIQ